MTGFIKTYRDEPLLKDGEPYDRFHAWIDLRMLANWMPKARFSGNHSTYLEKDELECTRAGLARRWGWSRHKVMRFLSFLEQGGLIVITASTNAITRIMITHPEEWKR